MPEELSNLEEQKAAVEFAAKNIVETVKSAKYDNVCLQAGEFSGDFSNPRIKREGRVKDDVVKAVYEKLGVNPDPIWSPKAEEIEFGNWGARKYFGTSDPNITIIEIVPTDKAGNEDLSKKVRKTIYYEPDMAAQAQENQDIGYLT